MYSYAIAAAIFSLVINILVIFRHDFDTKKGIKNLRETPQTLHKKSVSRLGGIGIMLSMILVFSFYDLGFLKNFDGTAIAICLITGFIGFLDDIGIKIAPFKRLLLLSVVPIFMFFFLNLRIDSIEINMIDSLLRFEYFALIFLVFAMVGMINAFNIIDGVNGLLSCYLLTLIFILSFFNQISPEKSIYLSSYSNLLSVLLGAVFGFIILNAPFGKIFLGDSGAYFLGAIVCYSLVHHQSINNFSPWHVMLLLSYPFCELIFSIARRIIFEKRSIFSADNKHLHHLILKKLKKTKLGSENLKHIFVVAIISILNFPFIFSAVYFSSNRLVLIMLFIIYIMFYISIYFFLRPKFFRL